MKSEKVPFKDATREQLIQFAKMNLGLDFDARMGEDALRSLILKVAPKIENVIIYDMVSVEAKRKATNSREAAAFEKTDGNGKTRKYCRILIPIQEKAGGEDPVPVGVNGSVMFIPRGEPQDVPIEYVEVLENAERFVYEPFTGEKGDMGGLRAPKAVKSYPFQYV